MEISIYDECLRNEERKTPCFCSPSFMPSILRQLDDKENMLPGMNITPAPSPHAVALSEEKSRPALQDVSRFFASACSLEDIEQPKEEGYNINDNNNTNNIEQNTRSTNKPSEANKRVAVKKKKKPHSSSISSIGVSNNTAASLMNSINNIIVPKRVNQLKKLR